ncbi:tRNA 5-methoxyuridine(34)/uridine 5-oxyacetic acid(34) synthase CmoB [Candidatus Riesia pediculischaeffi]|uniref:tRNA U34 carboxymethyltransferase n=2 Tax=Candidatus Riesia pediculischaeffi TaxID=428411 RepID=A0A1V0HKR5_9ENTR|nr:tRNA 5-methoxyuridine(34)/uridine 5-oxyacetic acid(34) synthase CmoB [Candidatus Riesia pediculischaeffi]ARC53311.1 tRNA (mo5U34)-methyltransferase [Candidatus Riesia pediculischaeffi]KIE63761.1 tRNA (5-methoxyuridine) 34 synthase [Candidatus Riesia pediculischaeffi PTSU]
MLHFIKFYEAVFIIFSEKWIKISSNRIKKWKNFFTNRKFDHFLKIVDKLPKVKPDVLNIKTEISVKNLTQDSEFLRKKIKSLLLQLSPWKKGPFDLYGLEIDSEWRSDMKWNRIIPHISSLKNRTVLDVGCGNGYYLWRILGEQAKFIIGVDPSILCFFQFKAVERLIGQKKNVNFFPMRIEHIPYLKIFDTIFSMGVIYHQPSPIEHLRHLNNQLKDGGELVLESLVIQKQHHDCLVPVERYSGMRNIYFIPSVDMLKVWLKKCGFSNIKIISQTYTSIEEQRSTDWSNFSLLENVVHSNDPNITREGYPSPIRVIVLAKKS